MNANTLKHFIINWTNAGVKHFEICDTFDEACNLYMGLNEISGEPGCPIENVTMNEVYLY